MTITGFTGGCILAGERAKNQQCDQGWAFVRIYAVKK